MVEVATRRADERGDGDGDAYSVTVRPNSARWGRRFPWFVALVLVPVGLAIGVGCLLIGAWPVLPFLALSLGAVAAAFHQVHRHAGDYERLTVCRDRLILERHDTCHDQRLEFNARWVQMVAPAQPGGGYRYLALRLHGHDEPFGRHLTEDERARVGRELGWRLARLRS